MRLGLGKIERKWLAGELGPGERLLGWSFITPEGSTPLHAYAMQKASPIGVVSDRALFIVMPRDGDNARLPFNLMDDVLTRFGRQLHIVTGAENTIVWDVQDSSFLGIARQAFIAYGRKAAAVWPQCEPDDYVAGVEQEYAARIAAGTMPHVAESETVQRVGEMIFEQSQSKQTVRAAQERARSIIAAFVAEQPELRADHARPGLAELSPEDTTRVLEAQRVFAFLLGRVADPAHAEYLYKGARLVDAVDQNYEPALHECLAMPGFAESFADAQRTIATLAPGLDEYLKQTLVTELRRGTHPFQLDLTTAQVWQGYVEASAAESVAGDESTGLAGAAAG